jgi:hypothetical protein
VLFVGALFVEGWVLGLGGLGVRVRVEVGS